MSVSRQAANSGGQSGGGRILALLLLAYILNFLDRQILSILQIPIQAELGLRDDQLGLMGGIAFALVYSTLAIPVAWLADRKSRVGIISISLALWSGFTALCGAAQNFWQLFFARMGVGVGEAGGVAPAYALIADYFPPERRARALAVFSLGVPIGSALGVFFGGWLASSINWRAAFAIVGGVGLLLAPIIWFGIKDPVRGGLDRAAGTQAAQAVPLAKVLSTVAAKPSFWLMAFGAASGSALGYGFAFWLPQFLSRSFGLTLMEISWFYGSIALIGGIAGILLGGWLGDRLGSTRPGAYPLIPSICFLFAAPTYAMAFFAPSLPVAWVLFVIGTALSLAWLGPVVTAIQHIVAPEMRATASAAFLFINNLLGIGFGIYFLGFVSTQLNARHGVDALQYSMFFSLVFYLIAAGLHGLASRRIARDWYRA